MDIFYEIERLLNFGIQKQLVEKLDYIYLKNTLFDTLNLGGIDKEYTVNETLETATPILDNICTYAIKNGFINDNMTEIDLFATKIMGIITPRPSYVDKKIQELSKQDKKLATTYFYNLSKDSNYIMVDRVAQNKEWFTKTEFGDYVITINVSKPEKTPEEIIKAKSVVSSDYPKCLLCKENIGFAGNLNHPARHNLRTIPLLLNNEKWNMQYSPYVYYNEHCIVFSDDHTPMKITKDTFSRLLDFVEYMPHYFLGSNADLPIVGGSILSHDHFQGGNYDLPMAKATNYITFKSEKYNDISLSIVKWPMSVIRLSGINKKSIISLASDILDKWINYSAESINIISHTNDIRHNTLNPIARVNKNGEFELDIVLRNNRTNEQYPDGIFHTHKASHHIKQENIGLIEVMGLGILPKRLIDTAKLIESYLTGETKDKLDKNNIHHDWVVYLLNKYGNANKKDEATKIVQDEIGYKFSQALVDCGVFKFDEIGIFEFTKFVETLGFTK